MASKLSSRFCKFSRTLRSDPSSLCRLSSRKSSEMSFCKLSSRFSRRPINISSLKCSVSAAVHFSATRGCCTDSGSLAPPNPSAERTDTHGGAGSKSAPRRKFDLIDGPSLKDFIAQSSNVNSDYEAVKRAECIPYLSDDVQKGRSRKVYFETYGCQMNVSDTEIAWAILESSGFEKVDTVTEADVILAVTCAIRENAEQKIWNRLQYFQSLKNNRRRGQTPLKVGLLGCMAERLKKKLLEQTKTVDIVAGPDAYRDLPRLLSVAESGQTAINVMLSMDETYADVVPVRLNEESKSAFVSIMRGCDNMCSYCIVPFTRGRERSRPIDSIVEEIQALSDQGVKEVTLLGQNVNSYRDVSESNYYYSSSSSSSSSETENALEDEPTKLARGFKSIYKAKKGGRRFADLLERVALVDPEMRIRFTSPHPKDFPDEVLHGIRDFPNICNQLHLPAQSGSTQVLQNMRRGYSREAYLELVAHIQSVIPGVALSSDFIAGFCGETEEDHEETMSLLRLIRYNFAFLFAYSMRGKTHAFHRLKDDVPEEVKQRRLREMITVFRAGMEELNLAQIGHTQLVLIEGASKRSTKDVVGRNDGNTKVIIPNTPIVSSHGHNQHTSTMRPGDFVAVEITDANSQVLKGRPLFHTTLGQFHSNRLQQQQRSHAH